MYWAHLHRARRPGMGLGAEHRGAGRGLRTLIAIQTSIGRNLPEYYQLVFVPQDIATNFSMRLLRVDDAATLAAAYVRNHEHLSSGNPPDRVSSSLRNGDLKTSTNVSLPRIPGRISHWACSQKGTLWVISTWPASLAALFRARVWGVGWMALTRDADSRLLRSRQLSKSRAKGWECIASKPAHWFITLPLNGCSSEAGSSR